MTLISPYRCLRSFSVLILIIVGSSLNIDSGLVSAVSNDALEPARQIRKAPAKDIISNFETNTTEGWQPRIGSEAVTVSSAHKYSGSFSLFASGRQSEFEGCKINVSTSISKGSQYRISVWARLAPGSPTTPLKISLQRSLGGNTSYHVVTSREANPDNWVRLTTIFTYTLEHDSLWLYVETAAGTPSFYIDDFQLEYLPPIQIQTEIPPLREKLSPHFKIGAAIWQGDITGPHSQLLARHFNSITTEDAMKWEHIQPAASSFNFGPADALVNYAVANGMQIRGHTLVWHNQVPAWVFLDLQGQPMTPTPENKALLLERLENHIRTVVEHYSDKVHAWDVVNEAVDPAQTDGLRRNRWYEICGPEYIDRAFLAASDASPSARLFLNDFETTVPAKRAAMLSLVQGLRSRGVPIDGIGHQMHSDIDSPTAHEVIETINMFSAIPGIDNHITELDISVYNNGTQTYEVIPSSVLLKQGYRYRELFDAFKQLQGKISSVTLWGKADDHTWLSTYPIPRLDAPLLFDDRLQAKPAFWGIVDPEKLKVEISGRVVSQDGRGLKGVQVTLIGTTGERISVVSSSLGYYSIPGVWAFENYTLAATSKRYRFASSSIYPSGNMAVSDFVGLE